MGIKQTLCLTLCVVPLAGWALQRKVAAPNETVHAKVAAQTLTRIAVAGERIQHVRGTRGRYRLQHDAQTGAIYLKPTQAGRQQPFTVFLTTEAGHDYPLMLTAQSGPAETVVIQPTGRSSKHARRWEQQTPYITTLAGLMQALVNQQPPAGYRVRHLKNAPCWSIRPELTAQVQVVYEGDRLAGEVVTLTNKWDHPVTLDVKQLHTSGIRALALASPRLKAGGTTTLFRIRDAQ